MMSLLRCAVTPLTEPQLDAESHGDIRRMQQVHLFSHPFVNHLSLLQIHRVALASDCPDAASTCGTIVEGRGMIHTEAYRGPTYKCKCAVHHNGSHCSLPSVYICVRHESRCACSSTHRLTSSSVVICPYLYLSWPVAAASLKCMSLYKLHTCKCIHPMQRMGVDELLGSGKTAEEGGVQAIVRGCPSFHIPLLAQHLQQRCAYTL